MNDIKFSSLGWSFLLPIILIGVDCVSGILSAMFKKKLNSTKMREGLYKKFTEIILLFVAAVVSKSTTIDPFLYRAVSMYICATELTSILSIVSSSGLPVPDFIKGLFGGGAK